jgi:hypothetical protein
VGGTRSSDRARTGGYSLKTSRSSFWATVSREFIAVRGDTLYTLTGYVYIQSFGGGTIYLDLNNGNGEGENFTDADLHADTTKIGQWQKVTGAFRTAPGTTGVKIRVLLVYAPVEGAPALKNKIRRRRACYA